MSEYCSCGMHPGQMCADCVNRLRERAAKAEAKRDALKQGWLKDGLARMADNTRLREALQGTETALRHLRLFELPTSLDRNAKTRWDFAFEMEDKARAALAPSTEIK